MQNDKSKFKNKIYQVIKRISPGRVLSYKAVAKLAGFPRAWRAVGNVLNKNRDLHPPKFSTKTLAGKQIPCHRVIRSNGKIGGYNRGIKKKIALLKREGVKIKNKKAIF